VVRMVGTAHDVTARVAAETEAAAARARLALAAELNDTVVQGLAVARYRLPAGSEGVEEVAATLERAKALVSDLLGDEEPQPGSLRRRTPAG
jgi:signal transduction histidine kinase